MGIHTSSSRPRHLTIERCFGQRFQPWHTLDECDITVSIDADVSFMNLNRSFEWLLNRWGKKRKTAFTMARDPDQPQNYDSKHRLNLNCRFVVAQSLPRSQQILKEWASCPDDPDKYPDCDRWKNPWLAEQATFGEYIHYNYSNEIQGVECGVANGFPEAEKNCEGTFVRYHWSRKDLVQEMLKDTFMSVVVPTFQRHCSRKRTSWWYLETTTPFNI